MNTGASARGSGDPGFVQRAVAASVLVAVEDGAWLSVALDRALRAAKLSRRDAGAATRLAYATERNLRLCDALYTPHLRRSGRMDPVVRAVLRVGTCELAVLGTPAHAAVHAAVGAVRRAGARSASGLVNAVLRRVSEGPGADAFGDQPAVRWSQQDWVVDVLTRRRGTHGAAQVLEAFNDEPTVALRVDVGGADDLVAELVADGIDAAPVALTAPDGRPLPSVAVRGAGDPKRLSCVVDGRAAVQDPSSTTAGMLLAPQPGEFVVDLAAGPGGKTVQLCSAGARVVAVEPVPSRAASVGERVALRRRATPGLLPVTVVVADGRRPPVADGSADAVLLDAPCSGLGTLGRRPDLRRRVRPADVEALATLQRELLDTALRLVRPGGRVGYAVCTFTPEETDDVVATVLADGRAEAVAAPMQLWPRPGLAVNAFWAQVLRRSV